MLRRFNSRVKQFICSHGQGLIIFLKAWVQTQTCLHVISVKTYLKKALWFWKSKVSIWNRANVKCDYTNKKVKSSDTIPEKSTLEFRPHSSWHPHYQILHSNLGQKRELPIAFLQKTHSHLQQPLEKKAEIWDLTSSCQYAKQLKQSQQLKKTADISNLAGQDPQQLGLMLLCPVLSTCA